MKNDKVAITFTVVLAILVIVILFLYFKKKTAVVAPPSGAPLASSAAGNGAAIAPNDFSKLVVGQSLYAGDNGVAVMSSPDDPSTTVDLVPKGSLIGTFVAIEGNSLKVNRREYTSTGAVLETYAAIITAGLSLFATGNPYSVDRYVSQDNNMDWYTEPNL